MSAVSWTCLRVWFHITAFEAPVYIVILSSRAFPGGSDGKEFACNAEDPGSIPGLVGPLEKEMATHSSLLAWRIPWTREPGGLQSIGLQRVRHDRATNTFTFIHTVQHLAFILNIS